jgi:hypothetical protein
LKKGEGGDQVVARALHIAPLRVEYIQLATKLVETDSRRLLRLAGDPQ